MVGAKRYSMELGASLLAYCTLLVASILLLQRGLPPGTLKTAIAVMPMLPAAGIAWAVIRQLRRIDEMQRRVQLEGLALSFMGTAFGTFTYGFLENAGFPKLSMFAVWPFMAVLWIVATLAMQRRYA